MTKKAKLHTITWRCISIDLDGIPLPATFNSDMLLHRGFLDGANTPIHAYDLLAMWSAGAGYKDHDELIAAALEGRPFNGPLRIDVTIRTHGEIKLSDGTALSKIALAFEVEPTKSESVATN